MKRRHVLALVASAALVLPAGGLWLWARHAENVLAAAQQRCRDAGLPMTIDDIRPPPVPDEHNASLVLAKLGPMLKALKADDDFLRLDDVESAYPLFRLERGRGLSLSVVLETQGVKDALALIVEATSRSGYDGKLKLELGPETPLKGLRPIQESARLVQLRARTLADRGLVDPLVEALIQQMKLAEMCGAEPVLLSQLLRIKLWRRALDDLEKAMCFCDLATEQISRIEGEFGSARLSDGLSLAADGERILMGQFSFGRLIRGDVSVERELDLSPRKNLGSYLRYRAIPGTLHLEYASYLDRMREIRAIIRDQSTAYSEKKARFPKAEEIRQLGAVISIVMPALTWYADVMWVAQNRLSAARIGLALDRYRAAHGVYPAALAELAPAFLPEVPQDFFSGKAFVYVRDADGLGALVYSVGLNMRDDGGVKDEPSSAGGAAGPSTRDDESWACGAAAKRKFAPPAPAASASAPAP